MITKGKRDTVFSKTDGHCAKCGKIKRLTIDHIIPQSEYGQDNIENLIGLCEDCNVSKGNMLIYRKYYDFLCNNNIVIENTDFIRPDDHFTKLKDKISESIVDNIDDVYFYSLIEIEFEDGQISKSEKIALESILKKSKDLDKQC